MNDNVILKYDLADILPIENALAYLKVDEASGLSEEITELLSEAYRIGRPCAIYRECYVESIDGNDVTIDGVVFTGSLVAEKLAGIHRVFPYVASCGPELANWAESLHDSLENFYANTFNQYVVGFVNKFLLKAITETSGVEKFAALNPGSLPAWPIKQQKPLFALLGNVEEDIGVKLTPSYLMLPIKSTSGILFPSSSEWFNCMRCRRPDCPGRQAKFAE
ncbi:MAG: vitamin B12 dependent-methionine synthase activation domain-containing protein [Saccharofermentanales bacterium]